MSTATKFDEDELRQQKQRQREQFLLSVLIVAFILVSWLSGRYCGFVVSSLVSGLLVLVVFTVWWRKSWRLLEKSIKAQELKVHRKRALRSEETAEWVNFLLNKWWNFSEASLYQIVKMNLDPVFEYSKPGFIDNMEIVEFTFGGSTPCLRYVKAFEGLRNKPGRKDVANNGDFEETGSYLVVLDFDLLMSAPDASIVIRVRLGGKFVGAEVDVAVEDISLSGRLQVVLQLNHRAPFPHMKGVSLSFLEKPDVSFDVRMMKALQVMDIPMVKDFINSLVMDSLTIALVDPEQIYLSMFDLEGETPIPRAVNSSYAAAVVTLNIASDEQLMSDEIVWWTIKFGDQERTFERKNTDVAKNRTSTFLVYDLKNEKCTVEIKGKRSLGTKFTIAKHKLPLKKLDLVNNHETSTVLEKPGVKNSRLNIGLTYSELQHVDPLQHKTLEEFLDKNYIEDHCDEVSGVLLVVVHSGSKLLPMDSDGLSDPYCIITANRQWISTTDHVANNVNPVWDSIVEFPVNDISKITLSFLVFDRDNNWQSKSDDFMGSCNLTLSMDRSIIIREDIELLYKVFGGKNAEDAVMKAGTICVSAVFRPIPAVSQSESSGFSTEGVNDGEDLPGVNLSGKPHTAKTMSKTRKQVEEMLLLRERGALFVSILQARDLVAMDNNGLSDPFCVVLVDEEKKHKTKVIDETLAPQWNETFSLPMLTQHESLVIEVFDKDVIKKEFMGKVCLSVPQILQAAQDEVPIWLALKDIDSGEIQLSFKVNSSDQQLAGNTIIDDVTCDGVEEKSNEGSAVTDSVTVPDVLSQLSGKLVQIDDIQDEQGALAARVKLEIPRKGKLKSSLRSRYEVHDLLKLDAIEPSNNNILWDAAFKVNNKLLIPKESVLTIELRSNDKKRCVKFNQTLEEMLTDEIELSEESNEYSFTKWLTVTSEPNFAARLQLSLTFSKATQTDARSATTKKSRKSLKNS